MKKVIFIEVLLGLALGLCVACAVNQFQHASMFTKSIRAFYYDALTVKIETEELHTALTYGILALVAALCSLAAMIIIAIKDFPVFKPLVDKLSAKRAAHKQASDAAKAEKAEADKKARIEKLTAELEELKKDE